MKGNLLDILYENRLKKLNDIINRGDNPFKSVCERSHTIKHARECFEYLEKSTKESEHVEFQNIKIVGRIIAIRDQGKTTFLNLRDETDTIQIFMGKNQIGEHIYETLKNLDIGDFIQVEGSVKRTGRGEITLFAKTYKILTKSMKSFGEKYHGISDVETRYRQRYMDMVANPKVIEVFKKRSSVISLIREWLNYTGYLEVETPMLHPIPGGATARPFITHHNTYDCDLYLRIAPELYLKKLIVGGFEKIYEINRCFRNEGVDTRHNPEFTTLELYKAYQDYTGLMKETENMIDTVLLNAIDMNENFNYQSHKISITKPWNKMALHDAIRQYARIDLESTRDKNDATKLAESIGVKIEPSMGYGKIVDQVLSEKVQPNLINPTFLYDYPIEMSPLAKKKESNPHLVERFQLFIAGMEIGNAFSELNDPIDQRERFEAQAALRDAGDDEAQYIDEDFITALEIGMPPTAGLGIGIDRLVMIVTNSASIRDVLAFPLLRKI